MAHTESASSTPATHASSYRARSGSERSRQPTPNSNATWSRSAPAPSTPSTTNTLVSEKSGNAFTPSPDRDSSDVKYALLLAPATTNVKSSSRQLVLIGLGEV